MVRRASDLLSCWVGATEQNIARAFEEARKDDAVLLIDEADSFLQDRRGAGHSWEVTQVNEVLTQMENFEGVFIATTNLIKTLDQAALRRFDMKLLFKPLTARQSRELFLRHAATLGIADTMTEATLAKVGALDNVTPGDFAAVARQSKFAAAATAEDFHARLKADCELKAEKEGRGHKIGF